MSGLLKGFGKTPPKIFAEGALLITEGGPPGSLFILESGEVEVLRHGIVIATISDPGAIIGEMSVLLDAPHSASVRARTATFAHVVENAAQVLKKHPDLTYKVAQILARRLGATSQVLVDARERYAGKDDLVLLEQIFEILGP